MARPYLLTLEYPPQHGGVAKYLEGEVKASPVPVVVVDARTKMWSLWPKWLPLLWRVHTPSCTQEGVGGWLWISHVLPIGYVALVWKWIYKTRYRVYLHGLDLVLPLKSWWKKFWVKKILQNADEIVVNSHATAKLLNYYGMNSNCARVQYPQISPPLPEGGLGGWENWREYYAEQGRKLRQQYKIGNRPILLTIGRLVKRKGIDLVIKALPDVWREIPDLVYLVVGEGEEREHLSVIASEALAERGNPNNAPSDGKIASPTARNDKIIFTGSVTDEIKYGWISACNCFILTPINDPNDFEGYGIVYKEAQMFNKPVIGSRVGGVPEAVGENGVLVEAGNVEEISQKIQDTISKIQTRHNNQYSK